MRSLSYDAAERLCDLRRRKSYSQQDVGDVISRTSGHISNVENFKAELNLDELEKLATFLEVHPLNLLAGLTSEVTELVDLMTKMEPAKQKLALKLFKVNLEIMEISKNWPSDAVNKP